VIVVCASIDPHRVVVPAEEVELIGEQADVGDGAATDVAALLGVTPPAEPRRALRVRAAGAAHWLIVGDRVAVQRVSSGAFRALPEWLEGIGDTLPLSGVVALDGTFAFALDVGRVLREAS